MKTTNTTLEITSKESRILETILNKDLSKTYTVNSLFKKIFTKHGGFDEDTRNRFLCPLLDWLKVNTRNRISIIVNY